MNTCSFAEHQLLSSPSVFQTGDRGARAESCSSRVAD